MKQELEGITYYVPEGTHYTPPIDYNYYTYKAMKDDVLYFVSGVYCESEEQFHRLLELWSKDEWKYEGINILLWLTCLSKLFTQ